MTSSGSRRSAALATGAAALGSVAVGAAVAMGNLGEAVSRPKVLGELCLAATGALVLFAFRSRGALGLDRIGPGVILAAVALCFAFLLGLASGDDRIAGQRGTVSLLFALAVSSLVVGAAVAALAAPAERERPQSGADWNPLLHPLVMAAAAVIFGVAAANLATGDIPLLASNVDATRFAGSGGVFGQLWIWIIGGVEWLVAVAGVRAIVASKADRRVRTVATVGLVILTLLAGRSFLLIVALTLLIAFAMLRRLSLLRLMAIATVGVTALGIAGVLRVNHSDPSGARRDYLRSHGINSVSGLITQSAATGPFVFATVLDEVPDLTSFQHGRFLVRDLRATLPLHPLGRPERADVWITRDILGRDPAQIGGSPPTLAGGLYIDFGIPGIIVGSALLGIALAVLHRWALRARTVGSIVLYAYGAAYVALAAYSYISVKPTLLIVAVFSVGLHRVELAHRRSQSRLREVN